MTKNVNSEGFSGFGRLCDCLCQLHRNPQLELPALHPGARVPSQSLQCPGVVAMPGPMLFCFPRCTASASGTACGKPTLFPVFTSFQLSVGWSWVVLPSVLCRSFCLLSVTSKQNSYKKAFVRLIDMVGWRIDELSSRVLFWLHFQDLFSKWLGQELTLQKLPVHFQLNWVG